MYFMFERADGLSHGFHSSVSLPSCFQGSTCFLELKSVNFVAPHYLPNPPLYLTYTFFFLKLTIFTCLFHPTARLQSPYPSTTVLEANSLTLHLGQCHLLGETFLDSPFLSLLYFKVHPYPNFGLLLKLCDWKVAHKSRRFESTVASH